MSSTKTAIAASTLVLFATAGLAGAQQRVAEQPLRASSVTEQKSQQPAIDQQSPVQGTITAPTQPQQDDPGGGAQGRQALSDAQLPDLLLLDAFQLANATIPWGTAATVSAADASSAKQGVCSFRYKYLTGNQGGAAAGASANRIHRDTQNGQVLASNPLPALAPGVTSVSDGLLALKPGIWMLYVHAEAPQAVAESDETNNLRRVKVTVEGKCG